MGTIIWIAILFALQYGLSYVFQNFLGFNYYISDTFINLVLSVLFTVFRFKGRLKEEIKEPRFHISIAVYFVVLMLFSFIWWWIF